MIEAISGIWRATRGRRPLLAGVALVAGAALAGGLVAQAPIPADVIATSGLEVQAAALTPSVPAPAALQAELEELAARFEEPIGIAISDVAEGWTAGVELDGAFPQQSVSKLWVAIAALKAVDEGRLSLDETVVMTEADRSVFYQPLSYRIDADGHSITIGELLRIALVESDNSANDKLMQAVGGPDAVAQALDALDLTGVAVGAYERDLQAATAGMSWRPEYGVNWNFQHARALLPNIVRDVAMDNYLADPPDGATPRAIARALGRLHRGELLSTQSTGVMIATMTEARTGPRRLKAGLPSGWTLGHKTGTGQDWRGASVGINDVGLATAPDGRVYAIVVLMRRTAKPVGERMAYMQAVSKVLAAHWQKMQPVAAPPVMAAAPLADAELAED